MFVIFCQKTSKFLLHCIGVSVLVLLVGFHGNLLAYSPLTHDRITVEAFKKSIISTDADLMARLGLEGYQVQKLYSFVVSSPYNPMILKSNGVEEVLRYGVTFEDDRVFSTVPVPVAAFHFFDPQNNFPTGRPLTIDGHAPGAPSPDWILESRGKSYFDQYFSYNKAQQQLLKAFSSPNAEDRLIAFSMVFQSLGHIVHHIQDMAQPQHVRNEPHLPYTKNAIFEDRAESALSPVLIEQLIAAKNYPIPSVTTNPAFKKATDYWYSTTSGYSGMAEFTAKNFITFDSGYVYSKEGVQWKIKPVSSEFPLPNGINTVDGSAKAVSTPVSRKVKTRDGREITVPLNCIKGKVYDSFHTAGNLSEVIQACEKLRSRFSPSYRYFDWDFPEVWGADYAILIPRAVAFSTGLINHFFRGQVNLVSQGGGKWTLTNESAEATAGAYTVLSENAVGVRSQVTQFPLSLAAKGAVTVNFTPPDDTVKLVVVFSGRLGDEDSTVHGRVVPFAKADPVVLVLANPSTISAGNSLNLEAFVTGKSPTGSAQFFINGVAKGGPISLDAAGKASINSGSLSQGNHSYLVVYSGDSNNKTKASEVVGLVVTAPAAPCGTPINATGGASGLVSRMDMGGVSGNVAVKFDAYYIPDGLVVFSPASGKVLATTNGLVSGEYSFLFNFDAAAHKGSRIIEFKVTGNQDLNTAWRIASSCPGKPLVDFPRYEVKIGVDYGSGGSCGSWGVWLDNVYIGRVGVDGDHFIKSIYLSEGGVHFVKVVVNASALGTCIGRPYYDSGKGHVPINIQDVAVIYKNSTGPRGQAN